VIDARLRPAKDAALMPLAQRLPAAVRPGWLTVASLGLGLGTGALAAAGWRAPAVALWLAGRLADGLDGVVARRQGRASDLGGYLDQLSDTVVYAAIPLGLAAAVGGADAWAACAALLGSYSINTVSWAYLAALLHKRDDASVAAAPTAIRMPAGLVEGAETVLAYAVFLAVPQTVPVGFWLFASLVTLGAGLRALAARRSLT
jgi:phosphatidylglycerophosphate synthase